MSRENSSEVQNFLDHIGRMHKAEEDGEKRVHKAIEKQIPAFLRDELSNRDLESFLDHIADCKSCQDELSIQYLVYAGMPKLETGETFNLQKGLEDYIHLEEERLHGRQRLSETAYFLELIAVLGFAAAIIVLTVLL
jgi:hypothetical protein